MSRWLIGGVVLLSVTACTPSQDRSYASKFVSGNTVVHEVYFEPAGYSKDSSIGTPLNKAAAKALKRDGMKPNVPYSIKEGADLSEAVEVGLKACDEYMEDVL